MKKVIDYVVNKYYEVVENEKKNESEYLYILPQNPLPPLTVNTPPPLPSAIAIPFSAGTSGSFSNK